MLAARDNLVSLARAPGLAVRAIGRVRVGTARQIDLLAIGPAPSETRLVLPDAWRGRANVAYDRLSISQTRPDELKVELAPAPPTDRPSWSR